MMWELLVMAGPLNDRLYDSLAALIIFIVGAAIWFKSGSRIGWVFIAAAAIWAYLTYQDLLFM